jgi:hypothetical protein
MLLVELLPERPFEEKPLYVFHINLQLMNTSII